MNDPDHTIWPQVLEQVRASRPELCRQWFEEIEPISIDAGSLNLRVHQAIHHQYLQRECAEAFKDAVQAVTGHLVVVRFFGPGDTVDPKAQQEQQPRQEEHIGVSENGAPISAEAAFSRERVRGDELAFSPDYTFDNFVEGPNNRLALAAARAIAQNPGKAYNPMFIHGDVGLGKTHLLQAISLQVLAANPDATILYIPCEAFITRFMESVQAGEMSSFRHYFRDVDMLVIDDIHFLAKLDRTQDEFFHTFNSLYQSNRQIILSSDLPPDEIPHLENRLVSRFKWGLVAQIDAPDYETRVAIVRQKARVRGAELPDDVASLIASRIDSNIRELEGALTKIQVQAQVAGSNLNLEAARAALGVKEEPAPGAQVTIETIVDVVTDFYSVTLSSLQSKRRQRSIALPRQVCMYFARQYTRYSLEEIGGYFGGRDHTTVLHAVRTVTNHRASNDELNKILASLEKKISGAASSNAA